MAFSGGLQGFPHKRHGRLLPFEHLVGKKLAISLVAVQFGKVDVKGFPIK
jgi:hypothetical protein